MVIDAAPRFARKFIEFVRHSTHMDTDAVNARFEAMGPLWTANVVRELERDPS